ncbi:Dolichyl-diphosphooligosaccharide--protein glycosyltransferase subunit Swp1 [Hypoxylon sp. FL1150]|nr:Dolichyl-diphosphooligosaccharide--protein glycosyltransferase subunit Swp1 [Hypoxylon sp. FL1150]
MRFLHSFVTPLLLLAAGAAQAASWGFDDAKLSVIPKKTGDGAKSKDVRQFTDKSPLAESPVTFDSSDSLKLLLNIKENGKGKRPHQAFLVLRQQGTTLEVPFLLTVKENGKATVEIKHSDLPVQFAAGKELLQASLVLASFGSSEGLNKPFFNIELTRDPNATPVIYEPALRYGKQPEIHHIFRADPKNPPKIVSAVFVLAVLATLPALFVGWLVNGANISHLPKALGAAPVAHGVFFGSIIAMEGAFYLYYLSWNLFQTLPVLGVFGITAFLSGAKALGEVQSRRLAGER